MNKVTEFKFWLAGGSLVFVFIFLALVVFISSIGAEIKAAIVTFFITVPGTLIIQYYFRKAGSNEGGGDIPTALPKANGPIGTSGKVAGWGDCATCDDDSETTYSGYAPEPVDDYVADEDDKVSDIINDIFDESKADGLKSPTAAYVASHIVSWLGAHEDELTDDEKEELINYGINYATDAYKTTTGLTKIPTAKEAANFNNWWIKNQKACKAPKGEARAVFMTLRDLLKRKEEL